MVLRVTGDYGRTGVGWSVSGFCLLSSLKRVSPSVQEMHLFPKGRLHGILRHG